MEIPNYIGLSQVRDELKAMGIELSERQIKRAADKDAHGNRTLMASLEDLAKSF